MSKPDLGRIIAQTMAKPVEGRTIETITDEILDAQRRGGEAILTIGRCLIEAKEMLPHGEWLPWLNEKVAYSERTAQNFMAVARRYSNPQTLADLGMAKALALLALPDSERDEFVQDHNVIDMSARQLKQALKERDEARKAAEAAKADASAAEQARAKMEADMAVVNASLEAARADAGQANNRVRELEGQLADLQARPVEVAVETVVDPEALEKARAEAVAEMQAKLDKAKEAKSKADEKRKQAEASVEILKKSLENMERNEKKAALNSDKDVAQFEVLFNQGQERWEVCGMIQEAINKLREQQSKVKERSPQWMVAQQLMDLVRAEPQCAEILAQDLEVEAMSITEAEKKIKAFADSHKTGSFSCVTPVDSDRILREFYGLPPRPGGAGDGLEPTGGLGLDLADFWG